MRKEFLKKAGLSVLLLGFSLALGYILFQHQSGAAESAGYGGEVKIKKDAPKPEKKEVELFKTGKYDLLTYYMHEVFESYIMAQKCYKEKDYEMAATNLRVMEYYNELSLDYLPDRLQDDTPFDKEKYKEIVLELDAHSGRIREDLKEGKWGELHLGEPDPMMETCVGCHYRYQIPTDFHIDTAYKVLTKVMHEIYEHYKQAGVLLDAEKYDQALDHFLVLDPYLKEIANNIPKADPDGKPIDQALFIQANEELSRFTKEMIQIIRTKKWKRGKPKPPPKVVVDNCYICHYDVANIPSPW